jgi:hypothetical protein
MQLSTIIYNLKSNVPTMKDAARSKNLKVLMSLLGPAYRNLILQRAKVGKHTRLSTSNSAFFDWSYERDQPELRKLYDSAKKSQWNGDDLPWHIDVDPFNPEVELMPEELNPMRDLLAYRRLSTKEQKSQRHAILAWMLSQFLHGEQGALFAACEVTEAVRCMDGKLYGSTQVVDEGRHVEVFHRYLHEKLEKVYQVNDNLFTIIDALMTDSRWDLKFLGMQIMIEGLALGAFGTIRQTTQEPLLRELLKYVITDEARHVHYGVIALGDFYKKELNEKDRAEREDWAFEMSLLMRNRFLAHEFYDEYYGHTMSRAEWDRNLLQSEMMQMFRKTIFRRIIPNLSRIGLLTDRIKHHYAAIGLLVYEKDKAAPEININELLTA